MLLTAFFNRCAFRDAPQSCFVLRIFRFLNCHSNSLALFLLILTLLEMRHSHVVVLLSLKFCRGTSCSPRISSRVSHTWKNL